MISVRACSADPCACSCLLTSQEDIVAARFIISGKKDRLHIAWPSLGVECRNGSRKRSQSKRKQCSFKETYALYPSTSSLNIIVFMLKLFYEMEPGQYLHSLNLNFIKYYHCDSAHEIIPAMFAVSKQNAGGVNFRSRLVCTGAQGGADWQVPSTSPSCAQLEFCVWFSGLI